MRVVILAALLPLLAPVAIDVKTESASYSISINGKKAGTEEFKISTRKGGGYLAEGTTKIKADSMTLKSRMELDDQLRPIFYEYRRDKGIIRMKIDKGVAVYEVISDIKTSPQRFPFPDDCFIVDNNFFHHFQLLFYKLNRKPGKLTIFIPQAFVMRTAELRQIDAKSFELETDDTTLQAIVDPVDGRMRSLTEDASTAVVERR